MASVKLVHPAETRQVSVRHLMGRCTLFQRNPHLTGAPYTVNPSVPLTAFQAFVSALEETPIQFTIANFSGLTQLCDEFGFTDLDAQLSEFRHLPTTPEVQGMDVEARSRIADLEDSALRLGRQVQGLFDRLSRELRGHEETISRLTADVERLSGEVQTSRAEFLAFGPKTFDSMIVSDFPPIFEEFRRKKFVLLWRGTRDGFRASEFHHRCDGHGNTLTIIQDTNDNVFGGFTQASWDSPVWNGQYGSKSNSYKTDDSLRSFIFTLKNPRNVPARKFALNSEKKNQVIYCWPNRGPCFNNIGIFDECNTNSNSYAMFNGSGDTYVNDTGLDGATLFTYTQKFTVREIEVFEIIN
jgi:hypothetical protein